MWSAMSDDVYLNTKFVLLFGTIIILYALYRAALPKPLPGIPYNQHSAKRLFGDIKELRSATYRRRWLWSQPTTHNAPITQMFLFPFRRPTLVVSDYREVVDICSRRTKEFDRGPQNKHIVGLTAPNFHFTMDSSNPRFKVHRELTRDTMAPAFLKDYSSPLVYDRATMLIDLWDKKMIKAKSHPFSAAHDLYLATLDVICSVSFGMEHDRSALSREIQHLKTQNIAHTFLTKDPVYFEPAPISAELDALLNIPDMLSIAMKSPFPTLAQHLALLSPRNAWAQWNRKALIRRQTKRSLRKLSTNGYQARETALDHVLWREIKAAEKTGRKPDVYSAAIRDEILGFLLGGHDTTATVLSWWVKYMTKHQHIQDQLRQALHNSHAQALQGRRAPTHRELHSISVPYFDAVLEETLRCASVATLVSRRATCDTQILGCHIPKGTDVFLPLTGPSMTLRAQNIPESLRTSGCTDTKERVPQWDDDVEQYKPERWLNTIRKPDGSEEIVLNSHAGPNLAFGAGPRSCFGKKLAYLQLRTVMALLIWNFKFLEVDEDLNGPGITERMVNLPTDCFVRLQKI